VHTAHTLETKNILMSREAYESGTERKIYHIQTGRRKTEIKSNY